MNILDFLTEQVPAKPKKKQISANKSDEKQKEEKYIRPEPTPVQQQTNVPEVQPSNLDQEPEDETTLTDPQSIAGVDTGGPELLVSDDPIENINKMYRLKRILVKMKAVSDLLNKFSDPIFDDIKSSIIDANDILINILIPNLPSYAEDIDDIIENYENFLLNISKETDKLYSVYKRRQDNVSDERIEHDEHSEEHKSGKREDKNGMHPSNMRRRKQK